MHKNRFRGKGTIVRDTLISVDGVQSSVLFVLGDNYGYMRLHSLILLCPLTAEQGK
jgi:hypothetical protein